ncbi:gephyrin-like molybdotransferase receptor GlpR [Streptomyces sp. CRN 30]|uniref:divisome protein SepX/GlpR n=1 Tax=Streptomyces sp. CRN 30 TaxID=3075613 RepID=UPI002A7FF202|nr:gephyrin-like molybdotransferase receptor GlpR [Streptomyces sp. CRN 30]
MSSSGLIYAVIVGAWAAYLVPMWLRRQDELNEARPTERFSTAIRLLSGRAGMERRYAKDLRARSAEEEPGTDAPDAVTDSVDVRAFAVSRTRRETRPTAPPPAVPAPAVPAPERAARRDPAAVDRATAERAAAADRAAAARARRSKVLARRRRTTVMLFLAFTLGAIVAAVGGLAFLWAPAVPAVLLSAYIAYLRGQERRRFAFQMDRRQAEVAAQHLRERGRQPRRRATADVGAETDAEEPEENPVTETDPGLSALAADRRALVEQTDHAEWVDQQRERQRRPGQGESWDPVPVPLPTYVTAPVAPRATGRVDLSAPDAWSSARSSAAAPDADAADAAEAPASGAEPEHPAPHADDRPEGPARSGARRAASARRARERGRTPLFDQYEDGERPKAANE